MQVSVGEMTVKIEKGFAEVELPVFGTPVAVTFFPANDMEANPSFQLRIGKVHISLATWINKDAK